MHCLAFLFCRVSVAANDCIILLFSVSFLFVDYIVPFVVLVSYAVWRLVFVTHLLANDPVCVLLDFF